MLIACLALGAGIAFILALPKSRGVTSGDRRSMLLDISIRLQNSAIAAGGKYAPDVASLRADNSFDISIARYGILVDQSSSSEPGFTKADEGCFYYVGGQSKISDNPPTIVAIEIRKNSNMLLILFSDGSVKDVTSQQAESALRSSGVVPKK